MPNFEHYRDKLANKGIKTSTDLCNLLLNECHVALLPGSDFYLEETDLKVRVATVDYDGGAALKAYMDGAKLDDEFIAKYCPRLQGAMNALEAYFKEL